MDKVFLDSSIIIEKVIIDKLPNNSKLTYSQKMVNKIFRDISCGKMKAFVSPIVLNECASNRVSGDKAREIIEKYFIGVLDIYEKPLNYNQRDLTENLINGIKNNYKILRQRGLFNSVRSKYDIANLAAANYYNLRTFYTLDKDFNFTGFKKVVYVNSFSRPTEINYINEKYKSMR